MNLFPHSASLRKFRYALVPALMLAAASPDAYAGLFAIAGDSTTSSSSGWGDQLASFLPPGDTLSNQGANGRSTKSFISEGRWQATLNLKPDYVLIQFGHNDQKVDDSARGTHAIDDPTGLIPGPRDLYRENLRRMIADARAIDATPILLSPVARRSTPYDSAQAQVDRNSSLGGADRHGNRYSLRDYAEAVLDVSAEEGVVAIDLNQLSLDLYSQMIADGKSIASLGPAGDNTHFNATGARVIAEVVANALPTAHLPEPATFPLVGIALLSRGWPRRCAADERQGGQVW